MKKVQSVYLNYDHLLRAIVLALLLIAVVSHTSFAKDGKDDGDSSHSSDNSGSGHSGSDDDDSGSDDNSGSDHHDDDSGSSNSGSGSDNSGKREDDTPTPVLPTPVPVVPTSTSTPVPVIPTSTSTATPKPTNTKRSVPTDTATTGPTMTVAPIATVAATKISLPTVTATPKPTDTQQPVPTDTATTAPTMTVAPVATVAPTKMSIPTVTATATPVVVVEMTRASGIVSTPTAAATKTATRAPTFIAVATATKTATSVPTFTAMATRSTEAIKQAVATDTPVQALMPIVPATDTPPTEPTSAPTNTPPGQDIAPDHVGQQPPMTSGSSIDTHASQATDDTAQSRGTQRTAEPDSLAQATAAYIVTDYVKNNADKVGFALVVTSVLSLLTYRLQRRSKGAPAKFAKNTKPQRQSVSHLRKLIVNHLWRTKGSLALAAAGVVGTALTDLLNPWPLKLIFDYVLLHKDLPQNLGFLAQWLGNNDFWLLMLFVGLYGVLTLIGNGFEFLESYITSRVGLELVTTLRRQLFVHLQRLSLSFHVQSQRGELLNKVSSDTQALREAFAEAGLTLITNLLTIVGMCIVMLLINWRLSILPLISVPMLFVVYYRMQQNLKEVATNQRKTEGQIAAQLSENLAIMPVVQAFGRERDEVRRFDSANSQNLTKAVNLARLSATISRSISSLSSIGLLGVVFYGAWLALNNQMTPGDVLLFFSYVKSMYKPIRDAVKLSAKLTKAYVSAQRIDELLSLKLEIEDRPDAIVAHHLKGEISFENVVFGYEDAHPILHNLSFSIKPGQRVALVGASGAGKSTITNLLLRLYEPQSGRIRIDGADIRDYLRESLRHQVGLVLQEAFLMRGTIGENIAFGKLDAKQSEIEEAARQAHIHDFIKTLPKGYNTEIGELGSTLSGGQRQRIAIARALIKQPSILILDEPTSALDAESKHQVQETIEHLQRGKTILCIAHQLSTVETFDKIIVMDKGRIVEEGTHHELLRMEGHYSRLYRLQYASTAVATKGAILPAIGSMLVPTGVPG